MPENLSKNNVITILSKYNLGGYKGHKKFKTGAVQETFLLETTNGKYVLKHYLNRSEKSALFEADLVRYLKKQKFPCPKIFPSKEGDLVTLLNQNPIILFEYMQGEHITKPTYEQEKQLVKKVAELANIARDYKPSYKNARLNYNIHTCEKLAKEKKDEIGDYNAKQKFSWLRSELIKLELPESLPKGVCHCDFHFSNVLFKNNKFVSLIDFDDANFTYLAFDLVSLIEPFKPSFNWKTWKKFKINDDVLDFEKTKKIIEGYSKYRKLEKIEKKHLFDIYKLSFLIDCVWKFERGDYKDFYEKRKILYLNNLGRNEFCKRIFS